MWLVVQRWYTDCGERDEVLQVVDSEEVAHLVAFGPDRIREDFFVQGPIEVRSGPWQRYTELTIQDDGTEREGRSVYRYPDEIEPPKFRRTYAMGWDKPGGRWEVSGFDHNAVADAWAARKVSETRTTA